MSQATVRLNDRNAVKCDCGGELRHTGGDPLFSACHDNQVCVELYLICSDCLRTFELRVQDVPFMKEMAA